MYSKFYGLRGKPFNLTPDPEFLYLSRNHKEALAHLTYGVESKSGFVMITGEVGSGKTTLLRTLLQNLSSTVVLSHVNNTSVNYTELLQLILEDYHVDTKGLGKTALLNALNDFLIEKYQMGKNCVLIIDESQNLSMRTLEGIRMLSNLETEKSKLIHTILIGQPGLNVLIDSPELEQLRQRISVRYHLGPLGRDEVGDYIKCRIDRVAGDPELAPSFDEAAAEKIYNASEGLPRLINVLCDAALLHGYVEEVRVVGSDIIDVVASKLGRPTVSGAGVDDEMKSVRGKPFSPEVVKQGNAAGKRESVPSDVSRREIAAAKEASEKLNFMKEDLAARENEMALRMSRLVQRELEFNGRLQDAKLMWKERLKALEDARKSVLSSNAECPPIKVFVFDRDPRIQSAISELMASADISSEVHGDYDEFERSLQIAAAGRSLAIAVIGADVDDALNVGRVSGLVDKMPQVPTIYLSDIDLSTIRRRMLAAGANFFLEKPNGRMTSFVAHRESVDNLKGDLLNVLRRFQLQYKAFYDSFVEG